MDIVQLDHNFAGEEIKYEGLKIYNAKDELFHLYGFYKPHETSDYVRMPTEEAEKMNECVQKLYKHTSGGRIRFRTDSERIFLRAILPQLTRFDHMPRTGVSCFDLYVNGEYYNSFRHKCVDGEIDSCVYDSKLSFASKDMRDILIHFPLYNEVKDVYIGLDDDAKLFEPKEYRQKKPVVCYGSSITQGACASHPGNCYANLLALKYDTDILNMGFSSGCRGEIPMIEYLSQLDMSVLIYDYDHNSSLEELSVNHERGYRMIRARQPDLPIVIITAADRIHGTPERKAVIRGTYDLAVADGDKRIFFIDGEDIYRTIGRSHCTVDAIHPNDIGFFLMAESIGKVLEQIGFDRGGRCDENIISR